MKKPQSKRSIFSRTKVQVSILWLVFIVMLLPTLILGGCLIYLFYNMALISEKTDNMVLIIIYLIMIVFPLTVYFSWLYASYKTRQIVGPIDRITNELDLMLKGRKKTPIILRPKDTLLPLADKINALFEKTKDRL